MDNWKNRGTGMKCRTCVFYVEKSKEVGNHTPVVGRCRRHAPTMSGYPVVYPSDWCGDHKLDENKLPTNEDASDAAMYQSKIN